MELEKAAQIASNMTTDNFLMPTFTQRYALRVILSYINKKEKDARKNRIDHSVAKRKKVDNKPEMKCYE